MENAIRTTLADTAAFLEAHSIPFAVIGGLAATVRGEPRFTADVDAVIGVDLERALELLDAVQASRFSPLFPDAAEVVRASSILPLRHRDTGTTVDLAIGLTGFERQAIARAEPVVLGGVTVPVVTAEDLLLMKVVAGRPRDTEDARRIVIRQGDRFDWAYVLEVGRQLEEAIAQDLVAQLRALREHSQEDG